MNSIIKLNHGPVRQQSPQWRRAFRFQHHGRLPGAASACSHSPGQEQFWTGRNNTTLDWPIGQCFTTAALFLACVLCRTAECTRPWETWHGFSIRWSEGVVYVNSKSPCVYSGKTQRGLHGLACCVMCWTLVGINFCSLWQHLNFADNDAVLDKMTWAWGLLTI